MKVKSVKLNLAILALLILGGCASNNKFASRKYTKGYYVDFVSKQKAEPRITRNENTTTQVISVKQELQAIVPVVTPRNLNTTLKMPHLGARPAYSHSDGGGKLYISKPIAVAKQSTASTRTTIERPVFMNTPELPADTNKKGNNTNKVIGDIFTGLGIAALIIGIVIMPFLILGIILLALGIVFLLPPYNLVPLNVNDIFLICIMACIGLVLILIILAWLIYGA